MEGKAYSSGGGFHVLERGVVVNDMPEDQGGHGEAHDEGTLREEEEEEHMPSVSISSRPWSGSTPPTRAARWRVRE